MNPHKNAGNIASKEKKSFLKTLKNQSGFNLIELMTAAAVGTIVVLGLATVFIWGTQQFALMVDQNEAQEHSLQVAYHTRNFFSQAIDIRAVDTVIPADPLLTVDGVGQLDVNYNLRSELPFTLPGAYSRFAIFNRETGNIGTPSGTMIRPTGVFFRNAMAGSDPSQRSFNMYFDIISTPSIPSATSLFFDRISQFRIQTVSCDATTGFAVEVVDLYGGEVRNCIPSGGVAALPVATLSGAATGQWRIKTATFELSTRHFKSSDRNFWFYDIDTDGATYRDIVQTLKVNFKNNVLTDRSLVNAPGVEERVHGMLYFYDYNIPPGP